MNVSSECMFLYCGWPQKPEKGISSQRTGVVELKMDMLVPGIESESSEKNSQCSEPLSHLSSLLN